jgi:peptidoglycan/LPS O-acetylase OafA/YrhL
VSNVEAEGAPTFECRRVDKSEAARRNAWVNAPSRFYSVQLLRAVAVTFVVVFHQLKALADRVPDASVASFDGGYGVDIFFPISGFVMLLTARAAIENGEGWLSFARRRVIRIVPLYWFFSGIKLAAFLLTPALAVHAFRLDAWYVAASFLFLPVANGDGELMPVLPVGWTLDFEMLFYAIVAVSIYLAANTRSFAAVILVPLALASFFLPADAPALLHFADSIVIEFLYGTIVAEMALRGRSLPIPVVPIALAIGLVVPFLDWESIRSDGYLSQVRFLYWGVPGALLLWAAVSLERRIDFARWTVPLVAGDASYVTYLSHGFLTALIATILVKLSLFSAIGSAGSAIMAVVACTGLGIAIHLTVEKPMLSYLSRVTRAARGLPGTPPGLGRSVASVRPEDRSMR